MSLIPAKATQTMFRQLLIAKKNSPHIFFGGGIAGFVVTVILASKATLKLNDVVDELHNDVENVKGLNTDGGKEYTESEYRKDLAYVYGKGSFAIVKLYGPATLAGLASVAALSGSHVILTRRNTALASTIAVITKAYDDYRARVREELGEEKEKDLYLNMRNKEIKDWAGNPEVVKIADTNGLSPYARFFDEYSPNWQKNAELNRLFVQCQQNYANNVLHARGHLFLNEVYDWLGVERSQAGAVVGWVIGHGGDEFVDFGMFEVHTRDFVNGQERSILLDFNVDGVIYDKI